MLTCRHRSQSANDVVLADGSNHEIAQELVRGIVLADHAVQNVFKVERIAP
jgi:hypothetical protein